MHFTSTLRRVLSPLQAEPLDAEEAERLWGAILDESLDDIEIGAVAGALAARGETREELLGLHHAIASRLAPWSPPLGPKPLVIPAYGAVEGEARIVALTATLLRRIGIPVVIHGTLDASRGVSAARVLREVGVLPSASLAHADAALAARSVAFVPVQLLSPGLAALLGLRSRLGADNAAHSAAQALDPTRAAALRLGFAVGAKDAERQSALAAAAGGAHVLLQWPRDDLSKHLGLRPSIEHVLEGRITRLFEADRVDPRTILVDPATDAAGIATWIEAVTRGEAPLPVPVVNLVAACLHAAGDAADLSRAKALAALHAARLAA
jgi:anthranilate phosphoribosyltransferase